MNYEAWRISYQSSEQAARAAYAECAQLRVSIEAMEQQEPVGTVEWIKGWPVVNAYEGVVLEPDKPLYALPGAKGEEK